MLVRRDVHLHVYQSRTLGWRWELIEYIPDPLRLCVLSLGRAETQELAQAGAEAAQRLLTQH